MGNIVFIINNSCKGCGKFNDCIKRINTACQVVSCDEWEPISNSIAYTKTNGDQIHECPFCGHKHWD
jgi:hypothetical protein